MNNQELFEKLISGGIPFDSLGHSVFGFIDAIKRKKEFYETLIEENKENPEHYAKKIFQGEVLVNDSLLTEGLNCAKCGKYLLSSFDGEKVSLNMIYKGKEFEIENKRCEFEIPKPTQGTIRIDSELIISNFFRKFEDSPEGQKYSGEWSLCHDAGQTKITEYLASQNIAFGQMGNMSIGIYVNKEKTSIIIGPKYHPAEFEEYDNDEDYELAINKPLFDGYELKGSVCLEMWRWMATDKKTLGEFYEDHMNESQDTVEIDVKHGDWEFVHYYDTRTNSNEHIYSILNLKEKDENSN